MLPINQILCGNALSILKTFPSDSIHCIITSPPYWGLRDYGKDTKTIWDGNQNCQHEWILEDNIKDNLRAYCRMSKKRISEAIISPS